jgi:hypothetical protein
MNALPHAEALVSPEESRVIAARPRLSLDVALINIGRAADETPNTLDEAAGLLDEVEHYLDFAREGLKAKAASERAEDRFEALVGILGEIAGEADVVSSDDNAVDIETALTNIEALVAEARATLA